MGNYSMGSDSIMRVLLKNHNKQQLEKQVSDKVNLGWKVITGIKANTNNYHGLIQYVAVVETPDDFKEKKHHKWMLY
jgi:hypothetical protein